MTHMIRNPLLSLLLVVASTTYGGVPSMNVIVSDASGKVAFKGATNANATFATGNLPRGNYVVQFNSKSAAVKGNDYSIVVSSGRKNVIADSVSGEKFTAGGVAMKVNVGPGSKITGLVFNGNPNVKVINGKRYVWTKSEIGSNLGYHWVEEGSPDARNVVRISPEFLRKIQDHSGEGSLLNSMHHTHRRGE